MTQITDTRGNAHKPAGTPVGGQFTSKTNSAPASELTSEAIHDAYATLRKAANRIVNSFRIDESNRDDIVQDSMLHLLERDQRKGDIAERITEKPFLNLTANKFGNNYGNDARFGLRSEDFRGRRAYREQEQALEKEKGRKLTPSEKQQLADDVRMSFPPGRRPKPHYMDEISQLSLDVTVGDDGSATLGDLLAADEHDADAEHNEDAANALHALNEGQVSKKELADDLWRLISHRQSAPPVAKGTLSKSAARKARKIVADAGGARELALAWLDGDDITPEQEEALFAPFGAGLGRVEQQRVCDVLEEYPQADSVWGASLTAAAE